MLGARGTDIQPLIDTPRPWAGVMMVARWLPRS